MSSPDRWSIKGMVVRVLPLLLFLSLVELGSGMILEKLKNSLLANPTLLVLIPSVIGLAGNLGSILSSRLSTGVYLGTVDFEKGLLDRKVLSDSLGVFLLSVVFSSLMGGFAYAFGLFTGNGLGFLKLINVSLITSAVLAVIVIFLAYGVVYTSYKRGYDPDEIAIPLVTNISDVLGVAVFSLTVFLLI